MSMNKRTRHEIAEFNKKLYESDPNYGVIDGQKWYFKPLGDGLEVASDLDDDFMPIPSDFHFTFDRETIYDLSADYRERLTAEQLAIFDRNWPYWTPDKGLPE